MERMLNRREVAELLGVPWKTLASWASTGRGPKFYRLGKHARYALSDVEAWVERQEKDPAAAAGGR